jgi:hypothetical protein
MNKIIAGALRGAGFAPLLAIGTTATALADSGGGLIGALFGGPTFPPITNERYRTECGGCHLAFPPGLLPADAWARLFGSLQNHFGDDASQSPAVTQELLGYVSANAGKGSSASGSHAFVTIAPTTERLLPIADTPAPQRPARPVPTPARAADSPPRITDTTYFRNRHAEIPVSMVKRNPKVGSFANCQACHREADKGEFNEKEVNIPNAGRWSD